MIVRSWETGTPSPTHSISSELTPSNANWDASAARYRGHWSSVGCSPPAIASSRTAQHAGQFRNDETDADRGERRRRREEQHQRDDHELQGRRVDRAYLELDPRGGGECGDHHDQERHVDVGRRRRRPEGDRDEDERDRGAVAKDAFAHRERLRAAGARLLEELLLDQRVVVDHGNGYARERAIRRFGIPARGLRLDG
jgi:hypothetical protein